MADLQTILASGDISDIKIGGADPENEVVTNVNLVTFETNVLNKVGSNVIVTGTNLGNSLSAAECETHIPDPAIYRRYLLKGNDNTFFVLWDGSVYLYERLSEAS